MIRVSYIQHVHVRVHASTCVSYMYECTSIPVSVKKTFLRRRGHVGNLFQKHQIRGRRGVYAAVLQGKGSRNRSVVLQTPVCSSLVLGHRSEGAAPRKEATGWLLLEPLRNTTNIGKCPHVIPQVGLTESLARPRLKMG